MATKKTDKPRDGWEAAAQTARSFAPGTEAGERQRALRMKTARTLVNAHGQRGAYRAASTENSVVAVGLVHLTDGGSATEVASGLAEWVAGHGKPARKRTQKRATDGKFSS